MPSLVSLAFTVTEINVFIHTDKAKSTHLSSISSCHLSSPFMKCIFCKLFHANFPWLKVFQFRKQFSYGGNRLLAKFGSVREQAK